jgi:ribosomal-protein-alanine N-acetyltransferase
MAPVSSDTPALADERPARWTAVAAVALLLAVPVATWGLMGPKKGIIVSEGPPKPATLADHVVGVVACVVGVAAAVALVVALRTGRANPRWRPTVVAMSLAGVPIGWALCFPFEEGALIFSGLLWLPLVVVALVCIPPYNQHVRFVELPSTALTALVDGDLPAASASAGVTLTEYFVTDQARRLWRRRVDQVAADPDSAQWIARAVVAEPDGVVIGHAGFHGPPDAAGMVEIGYSVAPDFRRQGYARAILAKLLHRAADEPAVTTVRATIRPDNAASLATISGFGFVKVGEQWDKQDGRELIFEVPANRWPLA